MDVLHSSLGLFSVWRKQHNTTIQCEFNRLNSSFVFASCVSWRSSRFVGGLFFLLINFIDKSIINRFADDRGRDRNCVSQQIGEVLIRVRWRNYLHSRLRWRCKTLEWKCVCVWIVLCNLENHHWWCANEWDGMRIPMNHDSDSHKSAQSPTNLSNNNNKERAIWPLIWPSTTTSYVARTLLKHSTRRGTLCLCVIDT